MASITRTANPAGVSASANVATYTGASIGAAAPNRIIAVVVGSELASTPIASCTIDYGSGDTAMTAGTQGNQGAVYARTFYLAVPTGTTATIKVTFTTNSPTSTQNHIAVYRILDAVYSSTGADQSTDMDATDPLTTGSTTIGTGGLMLAVAAGATDTAGKTWANLGEDIDADAGALRFTTAFSTTAGTATRTCTGTTNGEEGALSWILFADNTSPTTALNSPADSATGVSTTPVLDFTGTDADGNDVRYNVQVATSAFVDLTCESLDTNVSNGTLSDFSTASISPASNKPVLFWFMVKNSSSTDPTDPSSVVGNGLTWVQVDKIVYKTTGTSRRTLFVYRSMGASPSSGAITVTFGETESGVIWGVDQFTGADTSGTNGSGAIVQSLTDSDESTTADAMEIALSAFGNPANRAWGVFGDSDQRTFTAGSGFSLVSNTVDATVFSRVASEFSSSADPTVDISLSGVTDNLGGIAIEIKAATQILIDAVSGTDAGFANPDNGGDTDPFNSGENIQYTVQSALANSTVYYWRVRGIDPSGSNSYGAWSTARSFTVTAGGGVTISIGYKSLLGIGR
jgi:hypothetical protein